MKLYTDWHGNWVGTQAEFEKMKIYSQTDVPISKPNLLAFLNKHQVGAAIEEQPQEQQPSNSRWTAKDLNGFDIRDIAQEASLKDLTFAMSVYLNRLNEELS